MEPELIELIGASKNLIDAMVVALICWGVSKVLPSVNRFIESWRKRKHPDVYITYEDCIIEKPRR